MVDFAGYALPVQYPAGIIAEHLHTRAAASLFDVSHMGQVSIRGAFATVARALEALVPADIAGLAPGQARYAMFLNEGGGVIDDLIVARVADGLRLVVNGARKAVDAAHLAGFLSAGEIVWHEDRALFALQGPGAADVLSRLGAQIAELPFMAVRDGRIGDHAVWISRTGYTGEDGFEISLPNGQAEALARLLLEQTEVMPAGLGARDSLRLEAGLSLYGQDLDEAITPVEAGLGWVIGKSRRADWGFCGGAALREQLAAGAARRMVGLAIEGRAPVRSGAEMVVAGELVGRVTSGGFSPSLSAPIAMGLLRADLAVPDTEISVLLRGRAVPARVVRRPFVPHRYHSVGAV